jgi:MYXO-CTERM domain-containing protein
MRVTLIALPIWAMVLAGCTKSDEGAPISRSAARQGIGKLRQALAPIPLAACGTVTYEGCCDGQNLYYCENNQLYFINCSQNPSCGWQASGPYYDCGTAGTADPSGTHPMACDSFFGDAGAPILDLGPPVCGDGTCTSGGEDCGSCPQDCGVCTGCEAKGSPGCPGCACEACVCAMDSYCCSSAWDSICVGECQNDCGGCGYLWDGAPPPPADQGVPDLPPAPDGTIACGNLTYEGCCDGNTLWWCENGVANMINCTNNPSCGWQASGPYYDCGTAGTADPSGTFPMSCAGMFGDAGPPNSDGMILDGPVYPDAPPLICGDGTCASGEYCDTCPADCGACDGCAPRSGPGCPGCACEACVCAMDSYCCSDQWDSICVSECQNDCGGCGVGDGGPDGPVVPDMPVTGDLYQGDQYVYPDQTVFPDYGPTPDGTTTTDGQVSKTDGKTKGGGGCSCEMTAAPSVGHLSLLLLLGLALLFDRRRR